MSYCNNCGNHGKGYRCNSSSYSSNTPHSYSANSLENTVRSYSSNNSSSYSFQPANYSEGISDRQNISQNISYSIRSMEQNSIAYQKEELQKINYKRDDYNISRSKTITYHNNIDDFLNPERQSNIFAEELSQIKEFIEDAFFKTTESLFPEDIRINLVSPKLMQENHGCAVQGFAINRKSHGLISDIFIKKDLLERVMLTIGHEIGHVLSRQLESKIDEEAKAFAFSIKWMRAIKQHNIANLSDSIIIENPAKNGIHDIALEFVLDKLSQGDNITDILREITNKGIRADEYV